ncbi:MAG TPA: hypothetical protein VMU83_14185 [Hanamia sp.]|nr:hypothetical protein [Hanamia sp.]
MEVHHHPDIHHKPKKWKEYFLEFLMIFLAVTLGFFAESLRENIVNSHKEHQYMTSMVTDLKRDTAELSQYLAWQQYDMSKMDSALKIPVEKLNYIDMQDIFYHHFVYFYSWVFLFYQNDNTFTQLKNEGGFNVIRYKAITDSIGGLELFYNQQVKLNGNYYNDDYKKVEELGAHIMIMPEPPVWSEDTLYKFYPRHVEVLTRNDRPSLEELYSWIRNEKGTLRVYMSNEKIYREAAIRLIGQIYNKYHPKNN